VEGSRTEKGDKSRSVAGRVDPAKGREEGVESLKEEAAQALASGARPHDEPTETNHFVQNNSAAIAELQAWVIRLADEIDKLKTQR
jgi:hypothetical protein